MTAAVNYPLKLTASRLTQELSDFVSGMVIGTLLALAFRLRAYRKWVFPVPPDGEGATHNPPVAGSGLIPAQRGDEPARANEPTP